jgi:hypothetical protein
VGFPGDAARTIVAHGSPHSRNRSNIESHGHQEDVVLTVRARADHFTPDTGNTGGGDILLNILGTGLVLGLLYVAKKKVRQRMLARQVDGESQGS